MSDPALFELAGGTEGIEAVIRTFYDRIFDDVMIGFMFRKASKERLVAKEVELTARLLGGSHIRYTGKPMRAAHAPHRIMGGQFMRRRRILEESLEVHDVAAAVRDAWLQHTDALRPLVTADSGSDCSHLAQTFRAAIAEEVFVSATWLRTRLDKVVVVDVRWSPTGPSGESSYQDGHIPSAKFADLERELSAQSGPGRHPLPSPGAFAKVLARLGIDGTKTVVAYDDAGGAVAARMWWLLRYFGLPVGRILDGGIDAWPGELEQGTPAQGPVPPPTLRPRADMVVDRDGLSALMQLPSTAVIDARAAPRYRGEHEPIDPVAGHIEGAINLPFAGNLNNGQMRPDGALRERYAAVLDADTIVTYCGSGVTACHDLAVLATLGRSDAILYEGSWSDWCTHL